MTTDTNDGASDGDGDRAQDGTVAREEGAANGQAWSRRGLIAGVAAAGVGAAAGLASGGSEAGGAHSGAPHPLPHNTAAPAALLRTVRRDIAAGACPVRSRPLPLIASPPLWQSNILLLVPVGQ